MLFATELYFPSNYITPRFESSVKNRSAYDIIPSMHYKSFFDPSIISGGEKINAIFFLLFTLFRSSNQFAVKSVSFSRY